MDREDSKLGSSVSESRCYSFQGPDQSPPRTPLCARKGFKLKPWISKVAGRGTDEAAPASLIFGDACRYSQRVLQKG